MTSAEYLQALRTRVHLEKFSDGQDGMILCRDQNHTHFEIIDPEELEDVERKDVLEYQIAHLQDCALGY